MFKTKREEPTTPKELYTSDYFRKMRAYAEHHHDEWWILSAKHGLIAPDGPPIEPYDETLTTATKAEKRAWSQQIVSELEDEGLLSNRTTLVFHAGKNYYEELLPLLEDTNVTINIPTEGLAIGETKAWYKNRL